MCFHFCVFKQSGHVIGMSSPLLKKHCPKSGRANVASAGTAVTHTLPALVQRVHEGYNGVILSLLLQPNMLLTLPEKQASPKTWQLPTVLDWYAVSACAMLASRDMTTQVGIMHLRKREKSQVKGQRPSERSGYLRTARHVQQREAG